MHPLPAFLFIVALPLALVAGVLAAVFGIGALFSFLDDPRGLRARVESLFRRPPRRARPVSERHYYRPWWFGPGGAPRAA